MTPNASRKFCSNKALSSLTAFQIFPSLTSMNSKKGKKPLGPARLLTSGQSLVMMVEMGKKEEEESTRREKQQQSMRRNKSRMKKRRSKSLKSRKEFKLLERQKKKGLELQCRER